MRFDAALLLSMALFAIQNVAMGQSYQPPSNRDVSSVRVQTISVRRGPLFNTHRASSDAQASNDASPNTRYLPIESQNSVWSRRQAKRPGTEVLVNETPTSTMIEHVIVAPGQTTPSPYQKYDTPQVMHRANDAIAGDYLASETHDDGWNAYQPCCSDPWSDMCPCCDDQWDCGCCDTSPFAWLKRGGGKCATACGSSGLGLKQCRHCKNRAASLSVPFATSGNDPGVISGQATCDTAAEGSSSSPK